MSGTTTGLDPTWPLARRFPLVARPRPPCTPIHTRINGLRSLAEAADRDNNRTTASAVLNLAALLASDLGRPELARAWCRRHAELYLTAVPLDGHTARHALEPIVNLARLHIRDGHGRQAIDLLDRLYHAVTTHTDTTIDGIAIPAATLTTTDQDHQRLQRWLWSVHLADGTRALASIGRWADALAHLDRHRGIGRRMLDGRQVAVLAHATTGDTDHALTLVKDTAHGEPWENTVTACLHLLCHRADGHTPEHVLAAALEHYRHLDTTPDLAVFHTRLGLTLLDTTGDLHHPTTRHLATDLAGHVLASRDGYAARDTLAHPTSVRIMTDRQRHHLAQIVDACALGHRTLPPALDQDLTAAIETATAILTRTNPPT